MKRYFKQSRCTKCKNNAATYIIGFRTVDYCHNCGTKFRKPCDTEKGAQLREWKVETVPSKKRWWQFWKTRVIEDGRWVDVEDGWISWEEQA